MKTFYKLIGGKVESGSGSIVPEGYIEYQVGQEPSELKLEALGIVKTEKKQELELAFNMASKLPVTVGTKTYNGGEDSIIAIKNYIEYGIKKGLTEYHIWDINNDKIAYTLAQAQAIELAIADTVVANNFKFNDKKVAVDAITLPTPYTILQFNNAITAVNTVVW